MNNANMILRNKLKAAGIDDATIEKALGGTIELPTNLAQKQVDGKSVLMGWTGHVKQTPSGLVASPGRGGQGDMTLAAIPGYGFTRSNNSLYLQPLKDFTKAVRGQGPDKREPVDLSWALGSWLMVGEVLVNGQPVREAYHGFIGRDPAETNSNAFRVSAPEASMLGKTAIVQMVTGLLGQLYSYQTNIFLDRTSVVATAAEVAKVNAFGIASHKTESDLTFIEENGEVSKAALPTTGKVRSNRQRGGSVNTSVEELIALATAAARR